MPRIFVSNLLAAVGAIVGGAIGFYIFGWLYDHGWYGLMIPGALLGGGCGLLARHPSTARGIICGVVAVAFALFTRWWHKAFDDPSVSYFVTHLSSLSSVTWVMVVVGALIAFFLARDSGISFSRQRKP